MWQLDKTKRIVRKREAIQCEIWWYIQTRTYYPKSQRLICCLPRLRTIPFIILMISFWSTFVPYKFQLLHPIGGRNARPSCSANARLDESNNNELLMIIRVRLRWVKMIKLHEREVIPFAQPWLIRQANNDSSLQSWDVCRKKDWVCVPMILYFCAEHGRPVKLTSAIQHFIRRLKFRIPLPEVWWFASDTS